ALKRVVADAADITANLDHLPWRIIYLLGYAASIIDPLVKPITVTELQTVAQEHQPLLISAGVPALFALIRLGRIASIMRARMGWIEEMYAIARDSFEYKPLPERGTPTRRQRITATPHLAIDVRRWKTLTEGDTFF